MKLTANQLDMLYRVALAERFTCPSEPAAYDRMRVIKALEKLKLVRFDLNWRVTPDGHEVLVERLDRERAEQLRRVLERKVKS